VVEFGKIGGPVSNTIYIHMISGIFGREPGSFFTPTSGVSCMIIIMAELPRCLMDHQMAPIFLNKVPSGELT